MAKKDMRESLGIPKVVEGLDGFAAALNGALDAIERDPGAAQRANIGKVGNPITVQIVPSAEEMASDLITNAANAGGKWERKIQRPRRSFKTAGIAAAGKHTSNTRRALDEGRYAKGMSKVNEDEAIATALAVGGSGFAAGIERRGAKIRRVFSELQPQFVALARTIEAMPQDTDAQREARLLAARKGMIDIGKRRKS